MLSCCQYLCQNVMGWSSSVSYMAEWIVAYQLHLLCVIKVMGYFFGEENGKWENGASVKIPRKVLLVWYRDQGPWRPSGIGSNSQSSAPHNPSVGHGSDTVLRAYGGSVWVRGVLHPCWPIRLRKCWGGHAATDCRSSVGMRSRVGLSLYCIGAVSTASWCSFWIVNNQNCPPSVFWLPHWIGYS